MSTQVDSHTLDLLPSTLLSDRDGRLGGKGPSNAFEPAGDRPSNLVGTVLLHEVETSDDDVVLIMETARQSPDSARDEYTGLRAYKELRQ
jgi:hypothetical protein